MRYAWELKSFPEVNAPSWQRSRLYHAISVST